ncbi:MAG: amidohydrolase, partial [Eubacterium sp.]
MIIDVHIHCALSGVGRLKKNLMQSDTPERRNWFNSLLARYKKANVFALRDGGDAYSAGIYFKPIVQDQGIIYKTPIRALYKKGQYGDFLGVGLTGIDSCRAEMNQLLKEKPDFIKIVQSGIMSFEDFG